MAEMDLLKAREYVLLTEPDLLINTIVDKLKDYRFDYKIEGANGYPIPPTSKKVKENIQLPSTIIEKPDTSTEESLLWMQVALGVFGFPTPIKANPDLQLLSGENNANALSGEEKHFQNFMPSNKNLGNNLKGLQHVYSAVNNLALSDKKIIDAAKITTALAQSFVRKLPLRIEGYPEPKPLKDKPPEEFNIYPTPPVKLFSTKFQLHRDDYVETSINTDPKFKFHQQKPDKGEGFDAVEEGYNLGDFFTNGELWKEFFKGFFEREWQSLEDKAVGKWKDLKKAWGNGGLAGITNLLSAATGTSVSDVAKQIDEMGRNSSEGKREVFNGTMGLRRWGGNHPDPSYLILKIPEVETEGVLPNFGFHRQSHDAAYEEDLTANDMFLSGRVFSIANGGKIAYEYGGNNTSRVSTYKAWGNKEIELPELGDEGVLKENIADYLESIVTKKINRSIASEVARNSSYGMSDGFRDNGEASKSSSRKIVIVGDGNLARFVADDTPLDKMINERWYNEGKLRTNMVSLDWMNTKNPKIANLKDFFDEFMKSFDPSNKNPLHTPLLPGVNLAGGSFKNGSKLSEKTLVKATFPNRLTMDDVEHDISFNKKLQEVRNKFVQALIKSGPDLYLNMFDVLIAYNRNIAMIKNNLDNLTLEPDLDADVFAIRSCSIQIPNVSTEKDDFKYLTRTITKQKNKISKSHKSEIQVKVDQMAKIIDVAENLSGRKITVRGTTKVQDLHLWAPTAYAPKSKISEYRVDIYVPIRFNNYVPMVGTTYEHHSPYSPIKSTPDSPLFYIFEDVKFLGETGALGFSQNVSVMKTSIPFIFRRSYWLRTDLSEPPEEMESPPDS